MSLNVTDVQLSECPVCRYSLAAPLFFGGNQPLATLGWASSCEEALSMPRHPLDYMQCLRCTHVFNKSFTYDAVPYANNPNRMFNKGVIWQGHLNRTREVVLSVLPPNPTVIDIGCGEGHFVRGISEALNAGGRFLGFDPNVSSESGIGVEFHARFFEPLKDVLQYQPDLLIMRHVLEHLTDPATFLDQLAWAASQLAKPVHFFAEMPCIDRALSSKRLVDFFYEHPSHFTTKSFEFLMKQGGAMELLSRGYDDEVIYGLIRLGIPASFLHICKSAMYFRQQADISKNEIRSQLRDLFAAGKKVAVWGGTGKAAAFIHFFEAVSEMFPLVIDLDLEKVGTFVSKTGQVIQFRDVLKMEKVDVVIIPPQWRAKDIVEEMKREEIMVDQVLIEHNGRLIDFHHDLHPYR